MSTGTVLLLLILIPLAVGDSDDGWCDCRSYERLTDPLKLQLRFLGVFDKLFGEHKNASSIDKSMVDSFFWTGFEYRYYDGKVLGKDEFVHWYAQSSRDMDCEPEWIPESADIFLRCEAEFGYKDTKRRDGSTVRERADPSVNLDIVMLYDEPHYYFKSVREILRIKCYIVN